MEGKNDKNTEENNEEKLNNIKNFKIENNIKESDILKEQINIENSSSIRKENYNHINAYDSTLVEENSEKREYNAHDDNENITIGNASEEQKKKLSDLNKNKKDINDFNEKEKEKEVNDLNEKKKHVNDLNEKNKDVNDLNEKERGKQEQNEKVNLKDYYENLPTVIIVIGMAGSGKTTYVGSLYKYLKIEKKKKVYTMNLDPAVKYLQYPLNIDIRDSIKYHEIMKEYKLGPNGAIMTCLNLFATRFDKVIEILEKRKHKLNYIIVDTPGQIEVFNWSASGNIILETLSVSFPVVINYVIDTVRCERPVTFMSNMLYACSVLYKSRLPFLACFNKIDIIKHDKCIEWMKNYDSFNEDVLNDESYMASFSRSCALMINEFYEGIKTVGISSKTNEGFINILSNLEYLKEEYINDYVPSIEKQMKRIKKKKEKDIKLKMESLLMEKQKNLPITKK